MKAYNLQFEWELSENNVVEVYYEYYVESGSYDSPPIEEITIDKMILNGDDVTDVLHNYEEEIIDAIIMDGEYNIESPLNAS